MAAQGAVTNIQQYYPVTDHPLASMKDGLILILYG